jgi:hypothetical protein
VTKVLIKSKFVDYYDHQAHIWGGGDPSITYVRAPLGEHIDGHWKKLNLEFAKIKRIPQRDGYSFSWLVICGKYYLVHSGSSISTDFKLVTSKSCPDIWDSLVSGKQHLWLTVSKYVEGEFSDVLVDLSRTLCAPVFVINPSGYQQKRITVFAEIPNLGKIGVPAIISPEQMYQDISYFMGNVIKESPDMAPPSTMTDKEKIVGHGFDLKQSFRHRK